MSFMKTSLTPAEFSSVLRGGFTWLDLNRALLDRLNVFPVPDGDTGNNMTSTMSSGIETLPEDGTDPVSLSALGSAFNSELTRCSRGNSGFILARFFHGFFEIAGRRDSVDVATWTESLANGSFHVNGALFAPTEGTMISILAAVNQALSNHRGTDIIEALELSEKTATEALFRTPEQLAILARAGVIDSGALGMVCIFRGMLAAATGREARIEKEEDYRFEPDPDAGDGSENEITYRYCTEAILKKNGNDDPELVEWLKSMGDSIALVNEQDILKIHIHTNEPEIVFKRLESLGKIQHSKMDDMKEQSRLVSGGRGDGGGMTVLAFVPGEGFERIYEDFGVANCFVYRDTLPSPDEIAAVLNQISEDQIIVLPNNSNILPSVMAVREITDKNLSILPTRSVIQGITACYGFSEDEDTATNIESMSEFLDDATSLSLYQSARATRFGDRDLRDGEWFVTRSDDILGADLEPIAALSEALQSLDTGDITDVAVYHGDGFDPRDLEGMVASIRHQLPGASVEHHFGGQSRAALIISLE